jgi:type IV pilus assembly protein PilA
MKLTNTVRQSQAGFSLIELMVVVAIIGILAAIGIPQYSKFQSRARQTEAKSALSALYQGEASFLGEWNQYSTDLRNIGFGVTGTNLRYYTGFSQIACTGYDVDPAPPEAGNNLSNDTDVSPAAQASWLGAPTAPTVGASDCTQTTFIGYSYGSPKNTPTWGAGDVDAWTIDQAKVVRNPQIGL